jgi:hypothetical protein
LGRIRSLTGLPSILQAIKTHSDRTGQNLRQIFGKTKLGDNDHINQYQVTKTMNMISQQTGQAMDDTSVQLFINLISITVNQPVGGNSPSKKDKMESNRQVSFSMLQGIYNKKFNLQDNDQEHFSAF